MSQPIIHTPRLTLILLSDTSPGSQHVQWFHENWSDPDATAWSLHGPCRSLAESRDWMIEHRIKYDNLLYAVFTRDGNSTQENPGTHIGSVSLRRQLAGPTLPPLGAPEGKRINLRVIGYALFKWAWGKGYATEANRAMVDAYIASIASEKDKGEEVFYLEAGVDEGNPGSQAVLEKIGFKKIGWKTEKEPVFLAGEWRHGGYWIYGQYI
ncbi:GNAT domain-containing protein [Phaeosphaeriaceae sp. PMI808]|nr:GNAT domain-containing protein [Phaeosphaeriaceae sp. PMI808]